MQLFDRLYKARMAWREKNGIGPKSSEQALIDYAKKNDPKYQAAKSFAVGKSQHCEPAPRAKGRVRCRTGKDGDWNYYDKGDAPK